MARRIIQPDRRGVKLLLCGVLRLLTCMLAGLSLAGLLLMTGVHGEIAISLVMHDKPAQETLAYTGLLAGSAAFVLWLLLRAAEASPPRWLLVSSLALAGACGVAMCLLGGAKALRLPGMIAAVLLGLHGACSLLEWRRRQEDAQ